MCVCVFHCLISALLHRELRRSIGVQNAEQSVIAELFSSSQRLVTEQKESTNMWFLSQEVE